jgi:hypothetical protein
MSTTQIPYQGLISDTVEQIKSPDNLKRVYMLAVRLYKKEHTNERTLPETDMPIVQEGVIAIIILPDDDHPERNKE